MLSFYQYLFTKQKNIYYILHIYISEKEMGEGMSLLGKKKRDVKLILYHNWFIQKDLRKFTDHGISPFDVITFKLLFLRGVGQALLR